MSFLLLPMIRMDENNNGKEIIHMTQSEELASLVNEENGSFVTNKIYLDAYPEEINFGWGTLSGCGERNK